MKDHGQWPWLAVCVVVTIGQHQPFRAVEVQNRLRLAHQVNQVKPGEAQAKKLRAAKA
ncbi:MAG: hypothetical protein AAFY00_12935 [Bacteroidota bacterium]